MMGIFITGVLLFFIGLLIIEVIANAIPVKVKFDNGLYGIRRGFFVKSYLDFRPAYTSAIRYWPKSSKFFLKDCQVSWEELQTKCAKRGPRPKDAKIIGIWKKKREYED